MVIWMLRFVGFHSGGERRKWDGGRFDEREKVGLVVMERGEMWVSVVL